MSTRRKLASVIDDQDALAGFSRVRVSMILTDPRAEDNPIVYVNSAFERTTGYARSAVIGRNCRFLQGEETDKRDVDRLRNAVEADRDVTVDIINYRADGTPFLNRLIIAPISDADGQVIYFLGIQKEIYDSEREEDAADTLVLNVRARVQEDLGLVIDSLGDHDVETQIDQEAITRRLECLQLVYESMMLSDNQARTDRGIDLGSLISRVATGVAHEEGRSGIRYVQQIEPVVVNVDAAVRVSILVSEVLSNAFSHAFERMEEGFVELRMSKLAAGGLRITVTDDGVGLPRNVPFPNPDTAGGRLIGLLTDGLEATITPVRGAAGTVVMIDVPFGITET
ncbi:PAS domain S-box-containing protein [Jannaschia seohaensis]|uniref:PAS domain S-box-containing protein n=1 Tax=Jannaschia seohaensis TaxID=475081 RepID=A0A2Y9B9R7_9RHOB|nr:PAS domain S-box-containing protein [Jannaschia seohaensis]SSA51009.1 PAS domain S-box-containing protein [Jannaschia seohaensis]